MMSVFTHPPRVKNTSGFAAGGAASGVLHAAANREKNRRKGLALDTAHRRIERRGIGGSWR